MIRKSYYKMHEIRIIKCTKSVLMMHEKQQRNSIYSIY
nr:MAG TPA: hypothetical protein [Caudoviricetes sp.]